MRSLLVKISALVLLLTNVAWALPPKPNAKWHPGHYLEIEGARKYDAAYLDQTYSEIQSTPSLRGLVIKYQWSELETSEGVYNIKHINAQLERLRVMGKRLIVIVMTKSFKPTDDKFVPEYIKTDPKFEGGIFQYGSNATTPKGYNIKLWNASIRYRLALLMKDLGSRLNSRLIFEGIGFTETTPGTAILPAPAITPEQLALFYDNLAILHQRAREAFPNTMTFQFANYPRLYLVDLVPRLLGMGAGLGCPDIFPDDGALNTLPSLPGDPIVTKQGIYQYYRQLTGQMPLVVQVEKGNFDNTSFDGSGHKPTVNELLLYGRDNLKVNYIFWQKTTVDYNQALLAELKLPEHNLNPEGGLKADCPLSYASCLK